MKSLCKCAWMCVPGFRRGPLFMTWFQKIDHSLSVRLIVQKYNIQFVNVKTWKKWQIQPLKNNFFYPSRCEGFDFSHNLFLTSPCPLPSYPPCTLLLYQILLLFLRWSCSLEPQQGCSQNSCSAEQPLHAAHAKYLGKYKNTHAHKNVKSKNNLAVHCTNVPKPTWYEPQPQNVVHIQSV